MSEPVDNAHASLYKKVSPTNQYHLTPGVFALPIAVNPTSMGTTDSPVLLVTAHAPYRIRTCTFSAQKDGAPPILPKGVDQGYFKFLGGSVHFSYPAINANGRTFTWEASTAYTFVEAIKAGEDDGFVLGSLPINLTLQTDLTNEYGQGAQPTAGAVTQAGSEAKAAWTESQDIDLTDAAGWSYYSIAYYPGNLLHPGMLNADTVIESGPPGGNGLLP